MSELSPTDISAIEFLGQVGTDCVGVLDTEEKLAAALVFNGLQQRGYVISEISDAGPIYRLSIKGRTLLVAMNVFGEDGGAA